MDIILKGEVREKTKDNNVNVKCATISWSITKIAFHKI